MPWKMAVQLFIQQVMDKLLLNSLSLVCMNLLYEDIIPKMRKL